FHDRLESQLSLINQQPEEIYINESGLYSLILSSKLPKIKEFKRWMSSKVIPSIRKYGSYSIQIKYEHKPFYSENMLINYSNKNVIYIGYIGIYNNEHIFKFGKTCNIYNREFKKHKYTYNKFDIIFIIECQNNEYVEKRFKEELKVKNIDRKSVV